MEWVALRVKTTSFGVAAFRNDPNFVLASDTAFEWPYRTGEQSAPRIPVFPYNTVNAVDDGLWFEGDAGVVKVGRRMFSLERWKVVSAVVEHLPCLLVRDVIKGGCVHTARWTGNSFWHFGFTIRAGCTNHHQGAAATG